MDTGLSKTFTPPANAKCSHGMQCLAGLVDGHQRRAARGVDRHRRPPVQARRRPDRNGIERIAVMKWGSMLSTESAESRCEYIDATPTRCRFGCAQRRREYPARSKPPGSFQHESLLWIDPNSLAR